MAENIFISQEITDKTERYKILIPQLKALVEGESDLIANLANLIGALKEAMNFFWVGVYFVKNDELVLGPFQGPVACTRIGYGKGVCGKAWEQKRTITVQDVEQFPGHISCNARSKSEIVLPAFKNDDVFLILDADSDQINAFDAIDEKYLSEIIQIIQKL
jgi:L-methionine (R)-S-oxide reductase